MDIKLTEKNEKPLLSRTEIIADITSDTPPKKQELKTKFASVLNADDKLVVVKHVYSQFGSKKSKAIVYQYNNEEELKKIEPKEKKAKKEESKPEEEEKPKKEEEKQKPQKEKAEETKPKKEEEPKPKEEKKS